MLPTVLAVEYPLETPPLSTLVRLDLYDRAVRTVYSGPGRVAITLNPSARMHGRLAVEYLRLGFQHILQGYDHLLFIFALVLLAGTVRRTVVATTGFTIAHSVTLAAAALGYVSFPATPVEAAIALSIVFVAAELAGSRRDTITWRYPIAVASAFGLLHGLGFAAVLGELDLPNQELTTALFAFNLGVEAGQLAFLVVLIPILLLARNGFAKATPARAEQRLQRSAAYPLGILGAFWFFERASQAVI